MSRINVSITDDATIKRLGTLSKSMGGISYADVVRIAVKEKADRQDEGNAKLV